MQIDHVLLAVKDLDAASERLWETEGLQAVAGGKHPGLGTANRIVPLGSAYIELIAIDDEELALQNPLGQLIRAQTDDGDGFIGWCVATDDIDATAARLGLTAFAGARVKPDGSQVSWRLAGLERALEEPWLPFFIQWDAGSAHPSLEPAVHRLHVHGIDWVEVGGDAERLRAWLDDHPIPFRPNASEPRVTRVGIRTQEREIVLP